MISEAEHERLLNNREQTVEIEENKDDANQEGSTLTEKDISLEEFSHLSKSMQNRLGALKLLKEKGNDLYRKGLFEKAVEEYEKVDRFMGVLFKKSETTPEEQALVTPFQTFAQLNMAQSLMRLGRYSKALDHLELAQNYNKEGKDAQSEKKILYRRAKCYLDEIEGEKGKEMMDQLKKKYSDDEQLVKLIDAELKQYKKQTKLEMIHSGFKGVFKKTELYKDMPEPTPQPETTTENTSSASMTELKDTDMLQQYVEEMSAAKTSPFFTNKLFLIGLVMALVVFVIVLRLLF